MSGFSLFTNVKKIVQIPPLNSPAELKNYIFHHRRREEASVKKNLFDQQK